MYTRSYFKDEAESHKPPENYSGVALSEDEKAENIGTSANPWERDEDVPVMKADARSPFSDLLFGGKLSGLFKGRGGGAGGLFGGIGSEEILIIAMALFLLLSKDGDKECAIMLLILLIL